MGLGPGQGWYFQPLDLVAESSKVRPRLPFADHCNVSANSQRLPSAYSVLGTGESKSIKVDMWLIACDCHNPVK